MTDGAPLGAATTTSAPTKMQSDKTTTQHLHQYRRKCRVVKERWSITNQTWPSFVGPTILPSMVPTSSWLTTFAKSLSAACYSFDIDYHVFDTGLWWVCLLRASCDPNPATSYLLSVASSFSSSCLFISKNKVAPKATKPIDPWRTTTKR